MADNSSLPVASGNETFANDDIAGVKYPRPKINWGPDGTANDVDVASGKPLPVQLRSPTGVAPVVAAASTAPVAGDTALVVAISPNGQNANGQTTKANSTPTTLASDDNAVVALELIDDAIKADDAAFTPGTTKVMMAGFQADEASTDSVDEGDAGAARMTLDRKVITTNQPHTAGGLSVFYHLDIDESPTAQEVKATAGCLYKLRITNRTTSVRYVKLYNATAASTTVGTTTPLDVIPVPANASDYTVITESFGGLGLTFSTALTIAATTGFADNDTGAPGTNDVIVSAYYK